MKASKFPREYIGFDLDQQVFIDSTELMKRGVTLTPEGLPYFNTQPFEFVLLWYTGIDDIEGTKLVEGDICDMEVRNEFGSFTKKQAIMQWYAPTAQFVLQMPAQSGSAFYDVMNVRKVGHEFTHPELAEEIKNLAKKESVA